jgi:hypothetical protein
MPIPLTHLPTSTNSSALLVSTFPHAAAAVVILAAACGSVNVRPHLSPLPDALIDTLPTAPNIVIRGALQEVTAEGMRVQAVSTNEGYLETGWYHPEARRPAGALASGVQRVIKLRFWTDSVGPGRTQLTSEAVIRRTADPSLDPRVAEIMAPDDHPGHQILRRMLDSLRAQFGG